MLRYIIIFLIFTLLGSPVFAEAEVKLTQRDLMLGLVEGLGWSFGLPDQPEEIDYLKILNGNRTFRIEIEKQIAPETRIVIEEIFSFGDFSGQGWVRVPNRPTDLSVFFNLPLSGNYSVKARLLRSNHIIRIGDVTLEADGENRLTDVDLGNVYLQAGKQEISLALPPLGGIDFIELEALPITAIAPTAGWSLDQRLSFDDLAITAIQILGLHSTLPKRGEDLILEMEDYPLPENSKLSTNRYLGIPNNGKWVSIGSAPVTYGIDVDVPSKGVYDLTVNCVGKEEISGMVNSQPFRLLPENRFAAKQAGGITLDQGQTPLSLHLPPRCGLDQIVLSPRASDPDDFRRLTGLPLVGNPSLAQFNNFINLLATFGITR
jgi:hypothetical protein